MVNHRVRKLQSTSELQDTSTLNNNILIIDKIICTVTGLLIGNLKLANKTDNRITVFISHRYTIICICATVPMKIIKIIYLCT